MPQFKKGLQKVHTLRKTIVYLSPYLSTMLTFQWSARELILAPDVGNRRISRTCRGIFISLLLMHFLKFKSTD